MADESTFVRHVECSECGSSDANSLYSDGHTHCFACDHHTNGDGEAPSSPTPRKLMGMIEGTVAALPKRGLTEETCAKWDYRSGKYNGKPVQIAAYKDASGKTVAQKLRFADKTFTVLGKLKDALPLYGQWLWRDGGKRVVVTEGEIDAQTVSQLQSLKWPVVSVPNGADGAAKAIGKALEWLLKFDEVVFMFDVDVVKARPDGSTYYPGQEAAKECAALLPPGRAKIATLPMKDPNACLQAGQGAAVIDAMFGAKAFRPDGVVSLKDIRERVMKKPEMGLPWCLPTLTKLTYGRRYGEAYALGAGTGVGKTDLLTQQMAFDVKDLKQKIGVISFEQQPEETGKRMAGKVAGKRFHIPDAGWTDEELMASLDALDADDGVRLYDHYGVCEWDVVKTTIRYLAHAEGIHIFYLDHLTAFAAGAEDERKELERIMGEIGGLVKELNIILIFVSHLSTPEGKSHEEGGRVMIRHFKGSRAIGYWSNFMFGLERDQQSDDEEERSTTTFRILKDRNTGNSTGEVFHLGYDRETGRLFEKDPANVFDTEGGKGDDNPF